ncbi:hypothetical protein HQ585_11275 [candidate division KSB1 bacterium]|nr:hypothetical protein [candidate division KSB1 bacterium]
MKRILILWICGLFGTTATLGAYTWQWKTYTSKMEFRFLCETEDKIWAATEGGLVAFDPLTQDIAQWTNTEGLAFNEATAVCADLDGRIWIGFYNGLIQRYDPLKDTWMTIEDYADIPVTTLSLHGDTLFVGLDIGVSLYLISRAEVKETYRKLGNAFNTEIPVNSILVHRDTIWVGTDQGAAYAELGYANLLDPQSWQNINSNNGLPGNQVNTIISHDQNIYLGTNEGVFQFNDHDTFLASQEIQSFLSLEDKLYVLTTGRLYEKDAGNWQQIGPNLSGGLRLSHLNEQIWIGTTKGIVTLSDSQDEWNQFVPNTPEYNTFGGFAVDQDGVLWCASAQSNGGGFSRFDGDTWSTYNTQSGHGLLTNNVSAVTVDLNNEVWLGTAGKGVVHVTADTLFEFIYLDDGIFAGSEESADYVVVSNIITDNIGTVWFANFYSRVQRYIISLTSDSLWTHYTVGDMDGIKMSRTQSMMSDALNRLWIGDENNGVLAYDYAGTPTDKSDDHVAGTLTKSDGLDNLNIQALAEDAEGTIWVGTPEGLYSYRIGDVQVTQNYYPSSDNIFALAVDGVNNIWVGHDAGLSYRLNHDYSWHHFHIANSEIVSNQISALYSDPVTGNLYIGTSEGLSVLKTPFSQPLTESKALRLYPNPFIPAEHVNAVIDDLVQNVSVGIYTASGYLVKKYNTNDVPGRQIIWDGVDKDGNTVPSGVYLVVAYSESGDRQIGKLAVVR